MTGRRAALAALAIGALIGADDLRAQQATAESVTPGIVTMRFYQCGESQLQSAAGILEGAWGALARELVEEGLLLDYRILVRSWGDEWNLIEYYAAADEEAFRYAYEEIGLRQYVADGAAGRMAQFTQACPRRKDSQYTVRP